MAKAKTTLLIDVDVFRAAKKQAVERGVSLSKFFEDQIRKAVGMNNDPKRERVELPTHGSGWLKPGLDLEDGDLIDAIIEADDDL
jgi:hypothetical protein